MNWFWFVFILLCLWPLCALVLIAFGALFGS